MLVKICCKRRYIKTHASMANKTALTCGLLLVLLIVICYLFTSVDLGKLQKNIQEWTKSKLLTGTSHDEGKVESLGKDVIETPMKVKVNPPKTNTSKVNKSVNKPHPFFNDTLERLDGIRVFDWNVQVQSNASCIPLKNLHKTTWICLFDQAEDTEFSKSLISNGTWDKHLLREFRFLLARREDLSLLDIGSNLGIYSLTAAMLGHKVVCVEPFHQVIPHFHKAVVLNKFQKKITLLVNAISKRHEFVKITHDEKDMTSAQVTSATEEDITIENIASEKIVSAITWKDLANFVPYKKIVLKYDISLRNHNNNLITEAGDLFSHLDVQYVFMHWSRFLLDAGNIVSFFVSHSYIPKKTVFGTKLKLDNFHSWTGGIIWEKKYQGNNHEF